MKITKPQWIGGIFAVLIVIVDLVFLREDKIFFFLLGIAATVFIIPILINLISQNKREQELGEEFLEFSRDLAESVKSGTPIGKSIVNIQDKDFGPLSPHVKKLANQISLGIPMSFAFHNFGENVGSVVVKRAVTLIREAEAAGGEIDKILDSVANSIYEIEKLKKERQSAISGLVAQGYIIFLIFLVIMLIMQFKILPLVTNVSSIGSFSTDNFGGNVEAIGQATSAVSVEELARPFLYLLLVQGFFAGLTIGKLSEGSIKKGLKHSIILCVIALLISTGATAFL